MLGSSLEPRRSPSTLVPLSFAVVIEEKEGSPRLSPARVFLFP
jgi:hypothetical protein